MEIRDLTIRNEECGYTRGGRVRDISGKTRSDD